MSRNDDRKVGLGHYAIRRDFRTIRRYLSEHKTLLKETDVRTEVRISDAALESMVSAACEAYEFGDDNKKRPVETYAHVWGYRRRRDDGKTEHILIDRVNACVSAKGSSESVELSVDVVELQDRIVRHWSPHLCLLGDFHTHPFRSLKKLKNGRVGSSPSTTRSHSCGTGIYGRERATLQSHSSWRWRRRGNGAGKQSSGRRRRAGDSNLEGTGFYLTVAKGRKRLGKKREIGKNKLELQLDCRFGNRARH